MQRRLEEYVSQLLRHWQSETFDELSLELDVGSSVNNNEGRRMHFRSTDFSKQLGNGRCE